LVKHTLKKQSLSSCKAKYIALRDTIKEYLWLISLFIPAKENLADILTKGLDMTTFKRLVEYIGLR